MSNRAAAAVCGLLLGLLPGTEACMEVAWSSGYLSRDTAVEAISLASTAGTASCTCCAFCYRNKACASVSVRADSNECLLHRTVASYSSLVPDDRWTYFVMSGRSESGQFCFQDSDCQTEGDFCRGRVCTAEPAVTCRVIYETFGVRDRYGESPRMPGWLNGAPLTLQCYMTDDYPGYTRLFRNIAGMEFQSSNIGNYNADLSKEGVYSILDRAEDIRQLRPDGPYRLLILGGQLTVLYDSVPRQEPVLTEAKRATGPGVPIRKTSDTSLQQPLSLPHRPVNSNQLIGVMAGPTGQQTRSLARTDGALWSNVEEWVELWIQE